MNGLMLQKLLSEMSMNGSMLIGLQEAVMTRMTRRYHHQKRKEKCMFIIYSVSCSYINS
jgi:hypothetical protein